MSTDLDFCPNNLPQIRTPESRPDEGEPDGCRTPTAEEHKIPAVVECPAAPRKARRSVACKRKLVELDFFEAVNRDDLEGFFRSTLDDVVKRRCPCK